MYRKLIIPILVIVAVAFFAGRSCQKSPEPVYVIHKIDKRPIWKAVNKQVAEIITLKEVGKVQEEDRGKQLNEWEKLKKEIPALPCDTALKRVVGKCDSIFVTDSSLIHTQRLIIAHQDTVINNYKLLHSADSTNYTGTIDSLKTANDAIAPRQTFYVGVDVNTSKQVFISGGFDTRKAAYFGGYDPFNKQIRIGAYFKIKVWKRK